MTTEEKEDLKQQIWKQILIGMIPMFILAFGGSYMGVYTATKVDREKIRHVKEQSDRNRSEIKELRDADQEIWRFLIQQYEGKQRGEDINIPMDNV
jgi:hypothetical protein